MISILFTTVLLASGQHGPVAPAQTAPASACLRCHEDLPGRLSQVVADWQESVHHDNRVSCENCHGGDAGVRREQFDTDDAFKKRAHLTRDSEFFSMSRSVSRFTGTARGRSISYFCGKCHANIKEKHLGSPHGDLGRPTCLFCHGRKGAHGIRPAHIDIIDPRPKSENGRCAICHREATMETVATVKNILLDAEVRLAKASDQYAWLETQGYKNLALEQMYHHSRETRSQLRQTFHSFNMQEINNFASAIKDNAERTQQTYDLINNLAQAKVTQARIGVAVGLFLLIFAALLLAYKKTMLAHHEPR